jgi:long-chain acyl-CoA synthetase
VVNIPTLVDRAAAQYRDRIAVECGARARTFGEVRENANRLANFLLTVAGGARGVAVILPNCLEFVEVDFGIAKAGYPSVQISTRLTAPEISRILLDSGVGVVLFDRLVLAALDEVRADLDPSCVFVCLGDQASWAAEYYDVLGQAASGASPVAGWGPDRLYRLAYTSGTTGAPKGVMLSTRSIIGVTRNILAEFRPARPRDRLLHLAPLCHGTGMFVLPWFIIGGTSVIHERFEPERVLASVADEGIGTIKAVPTMLVRMLHCGDSQFARLRDVGQVIYGGSPMAVEPMLQALELAGPVFTQLYGQSEAPMTISVLPPEDHAPGPDGTPGLLTSAGRPWACVDVAVLDDEGKKLPAGEVGEIAVAGDLVMDGYWHNPAETERTLADGWVRTRDIGMLDDRQYLFLLDRKNDMIISGGMNVYPREVEDVLHAHAGIAEAAVFGVPDPDWGEAVVAAVAAGDGQPVDTGKLLALCRERLAGYKVPKRIVVLDEVPKNAIGKISRKLVRDSLAERPGAPAGTG